MLSISNVSIEQASTYYSKDNYYTKQRGEFRGKAVRKLGFTEELKHEHFIQMLHGQNAQGKNLRKEKQTGKTRAGLDHTFTAPKSLSILLELAEAKNNKLGEKIREAHDRAVNVTLLHIEDNYIYTRVREDGERKQGKTGNMIVAKFEHDTSRELDPTLHTHCVIANLTQLENGKWQAISNEELYKNKILNGQIYRSELAKNLKELGLDIEITNSKQMLFELKDIDKSLIKEFSKRSEQIKSKMQELREKYPNATEVELKQYATLESRKAKKEVDRDQVRIDNLARAEILIDTHKLLSTIQKTNIQFKEIDIKELIKKTAEIIIETESVFSKEDILKIATKLSLGDVKASVIWQQIENTDLIKIENNQFTTKEILQKEREIIEYLHSTKNTKQAINTKEKSQEFAEKNYSTFTKGQQEAFTLIVTSKDSLIGIQGDAGSGKTYMLKALKEFTENSNIELIGLAYTGQAADELQKDSSIKSTTLHSYLAKELEEEGEKEKIYIVDEASLVGSKQMHQLIQRAKKESAKIVLVGDTKQFQTISAGAIFDQLQQRGMATAEMLENIRQRESKTLREVVKNIKNKNTDRAFEILKDSDSIIETSMLHKSAVEEFKKDEEVLIIASTNRDRKELNTQIRELKLENQEIKEEKTIIVKESLNVLAEQKFFINNYQKGQLAFINKSKNGLKAGKQAKIVSIDRDKNQATLSFKNKDKEILKTIDISKTGDQLSIYQEKNLKFGLGEKITFTKNDKKLKIKNGNIGTIIKLDKQGNMTVKLDKKEVSFNLKQYNYLDYGYAITDFKAQGATAKNVAIVANSKMTNINSFYVQVTRAKKRVKIITDSLEILQENVTREVSKSSTLDFSFLKQENKSSETINNKPNNKELKMSNHHYKLTQQEFHQLSQKTKQELHQADPAQVLNALGISYKFQQNRYIFKLREEERTASANMYQDQSGAWKFKDFGSGKNGTIENVVMERLNLNYIDALKYSIENSNCTDYIAQSLDQKTNQNLFKQTQQQEQKMESKQQQQQNTQKSKITKVEELNQAAKDYLKSRGITHIPPALKLITGEYINKKNETKKVFGIGTINQKGGADIHFLRKLGEMKTMNLGGKDITVIQNFDFEKLQEKWRKKEKNRNVKPKKKIAIYESVVDYASVHEEALKHGESHAFGLEYSLLFGINIIGDSVANWRRVATEINKHKEKGIDVELSFFAQNDKAGIEFAENIAKETNIKDFKIVKYAENEKGKDINDLLKSGVNIADRVKSADIEELKKMKKELEEDISIATVQTQQTPEHSDFIKSLQEKYRRVDSIISRIEVANNYPEGELYEKIDSLPDEKQDIEQTFVGIENSAKINEGFAIKLIKGIFNSIDKIKEGKGAVKFFEIIKKMSDKIQSKNKEKIQEEERER